MKCFRLLLLLGFVIAFCGVRVWAQTYRCPRISTPLELDGRLDDPVWKSAEWIALRGNSKGSLPVLEGRAAILWDRENLYLAYDFVDSNILSTIETRDARLWVQDVAEIFLSPLKSERVYYEFQFNPRENWRDVLILHKKEGNQIQPLSEWNSTTRVRAVIRGTLDDNLDQDSGWTLEVAIPFQDLWLAPNSPPEPGDRWLFNMFRIDYGGKQPELTAWRPTGQVTFHVPDKFGILLFEENPGPEANQP